MKSEKYILALSAILILLCVQSCDFMRKVAGRPSSAVIESKREMIAREDSVRMEEERALALRKDYEEKAARALSFFDTTLVTMRLSESKVKVRAELQHKYYIVVGTFSIEEYANRVCDRLIEGGFNYEIILYGTGKTTIGAIPTDDIVELYEVYLKLRENAVCPKDAFLLINE